MLFFSCNTLNQIFSTGSVTQFYMMHTTQFHFFQSTPFLYNVYTDSNPSSWKCTCGLILSQKTIFVSRLRKATDLKFWQVMRSFKELLLLHKKGSEDKYRRVRRSHSWVHVTFRWQTGGAGSSFQHPLTGQPETTKGQIYHTTHTTSSSYYAYINSFLHQNPKNRKAKVLIEPLSQLTWHSVCVCVN